jgi:hypothetical protein
MTYERWIQAVRAKVNTSWNLHQLLPKTIDFFILVSSVSGIYGLPSQSNYAAGNTFQDGLARMRALTPELGTSVSIGLGWMQSIGHVAEKADDWRMREGMRDMVPVQAEDLLAVLEHYCDPSLPTLSPEQSQILIGMNTPAAFRSEGKTPPLYFERPLFAPFNVKRPLAATGGDLMNSSQEDVVQLFKSANSATERSAVVVQALKDKLARALGINIEEIDEHRGPADYGVDSLLAVELRNWAWQNFRASIAVFDITSGRNIAGVADVVVEKAE